MKSALVWAVVVLIMAYTAHGLLARLDAYFMMSELEAKVSEFDRCEARRESCRGCLLQAGAMLRVAERIAVHPGATVSQREIAVLKLLYWQDFGQQEVICTYLEE